MAGGAGAQTYHGPDGVRQAFEKWFETWEWMHVEIEEMHRGRATACSFTPASARQGQGQRHRGRDQVLNVYTFRDGK